MKNLKLLSLGFLLLGFSAVSMAGCAARSDSECHGRADCKDCKEKCKDKKDCKDCKKMKKSDCKDCQKSKAK